MNAHEIVKRPLETEKGTHLRTLQNVYLFEVNKAANKLQIRKAIEQLFGVHVTGVRTVIGHGKVVRRGMNLGKKRNMKKAYVSLKEGEKIALFEGA